MWGTGGKKANGDGTNGVTWNLGCGRGCGRESGVVTVGEMMGAGRRGRVRTKDATGVESDEGYGCVNEM